MNISDWAALIGLVITVLGLLCKMVRELVLMRRSVQSQEVFQRRSWRRLNRHERRLDKHEIIIGKHAHTIDELRARGGACVTTDNSPKHA